jgi:type VI protein secretion system component Hcp
MKSSILVPVALIMTLSTNALLAQTKMILTLDGKESDIFGYSLDPSTGSAKEISMFGPMQNAAPVFQSNFMSGKPLPAVNISITDAAAGASTINLTGVMVLAIKQYISTYSNGSFTVAPGGNVNTEVKCKYEKIEIKTGAPININKPENVNILSQTNEQKWVISNASIKGATGKISVTLPADAECEIKIYDPADNKFLGSFKKSDAIILFPGTYKVKVSNADVNDVPVRQGMETRLKAGILSLASPVDYKLYDLTKKTFFGSYKGPKKIGLPVGIYQLSLNERFQQIVIKDGETLEF